MVKTEPGCTTFTLISEDRPSSWEFPEGEGEEGFPITEITSDCEEEVLSVQGQGSALEVIVDTGATGNICSLATAERWTELGYLIKIDPQERKRYRVANGQSVESLSRAEFALPGFDRIQFDVAESEGVPTLVGMSYLGKGQLDMKNSRLLIEKKKIQLVRKPNGHLVVDLGGKYKAATAATADL